jgi:Icc-related predicted phosphoesterase
VHLRVAGLGGTFAPTWFDTPAAKLPHTPRDDKRRHFVRDEVLQCKSLTAIDLFLTHEAPRPFYPAGRRIDAGKTVLNDVLAAMKPRLHLFGHHHEFTDSVRQSIRSIGLDIVTKSYLLIDAETFKTERLDT